jgi:hypothetical protein
MRLKITGTRIAVGGRQRKERLMVHGCLLEWDWFLDMGTYMVHGFP